MSEILLRTVHGSNLYGLNHENSDQDYYEVYSGKGRARQTIVGGVDTLRISFDSFMLQCKKGVPQALEALYSPVKEVDKITYIVDSFVPVNCEVYKTYVRTINNFWKTGEYKRKRHAIRLFLNLSDMLNFWRFNPRLSDYEKLMVNLLAYFDTKECPGLTEDILGFPLYLW
jgi:hypothetical protein